MNTKITFVELVGLISEATSTTKRVSELFLRELFATVSQALIDGESVKIKGIGTFKVTQVKPRQSVSVSSGESIRLSAHNKLTFTPDKSLAEAINQPFAQFEPVILEDAVTDEKLAEIDKMHASALSQEPVADSDAPALAAAASQQIDDKPIEPAEETVTVKPQEPNTMDEAVPAAPAPFELPEMQEAAPAPEPDLLFGLAAAEEPVPHGNLTDVSPVDEPPLEPAEAKKEEPKPAPVKAPVSRKPMLVGIPIDGPSQPVPEPEKEEETNANGRFYRPELRNAYTPTPEQIEAASHKPDRRWMWILLSLIGAALLFWAIARGCSDNNAAQHEKEVVAADTIADDDESITEAKVETKAESKPEAKPEVKPEAKSADKVEPKPEELKKSEPVKAEKQEAKPSGDKGVVTDVVTSQIVLTTLSEKHYGSPWFWVYIYEENVKRGIVNDPNNIRPGTRVVIPPADKYGINPKDKASLKKAQIKSMEYLKGH